MLSENTQKSSPSSRMLISLPDNTEGVLPECVTPGGRFHSGVETKSAKFFVVLSLHSKKKKNLQEIHHITQSELGCQFNKHIQNLWQFRCKRLLIFSKDIACCKLSDYLILMSLPIMIPFCTGLRGRSTRRIRFYRISEKSLCRTSGCGERCYIFVMLHAGLSVSPPIRKQHLNYHYSNFLV